MTIYIKLKMDINIRERLEEEMCNCKSIRPYKNRVRKHNEILPNEIVENILSFIPCECKRCVRTREVLDKKKNDDGAEKDLKVWIEYFIELNKFPTIKTFGKYVNYYDENTFHNMKCLYRALPDPDFHILLNRSSNLKDKFRCTMIWMLGGRWRRPYPQIFNKDFHIQAMGYILEK